MKILVIPDCQVKEGVPTEHLTWAGKAMVEYKPDVIVCLGDFADMPSLSSYDKGTKGFEGRRYKRDVDAVIDAQYKLFAPIKKHNNYLSSQKVKQYKPKMYMTLGNHEDRINRVINSSPELEGAIGMDDLKYRKFGWQLTQFKHVLTIKGISFSHYFTSGVAGRPISSTNTATAMVNKLHCSSVQGHSHLYNHAEQTRPDGQKIFGLSGGCFSHPHYSENWCRDTEYQWWRGVIMLEGLDGEGYYDGIHAVTQRSIC